MEPAPRAPAESASSPAEPPTAPSSSAPATAPTLRDLAIVATLVLGVVASYAQVRGFGFVNYDDQDYVYENYVVRRGLSWQGIAWAFTTGHAANWHPLTWVSHLADVSMFGLWAGGHHLTAVAFHAANAVLLFVLLRVMTRRTWPSAFAAALFAWHPLRAESVAWVSERKDVLSTFFGLLSLIAYGLHARRDRTGGGRWYAASLVALALSLLSKGMFVTMPFVMLLLDVWPLRRVDLFDPADRRHQIGPLLLEKLPMLGLAAAAAFTTYAVQAHAGSVMEQAQIGPGPRVRNAIVSVVGYLRMTAAPYGLASYYPHPYTIVGGSIPVAKVAGCLALILAITMTSLLALRRRPYLAVGWLWFCGTLLPVIGLVQVGNQALADRYTYVPGIGLAIAVCWLLADVPGRATQRIVAGLGAAVLIAYGVAAYRQVGYWHDSVTLMTRGVEAVPDSVVAHTNLGVALFVRGDLAGAEREYRRSVEMFEADPGANANLANLLLKTGRLAEAGRYAEAAVRADPNFAPAYAIRGDWHVAAGDRDAAYADYARAIALKPSDKRPYHNYALALAGAGRLEEAKAQWRHALEIDPDYAIALAGYGRALLVTGETAEAYRTLRRAIAADPQDDATLCVLAWAMATNGDPQFRNPREAAALATRAARLSPRDPRPVDALAAASAAGGAFPQATQAADQAAALADAAGKAPLAAAIRARAALYRAGKPYVAGGQKP